MNVLCLSIMVLTCVLSGCDSAETTAQKKAEHLATLTCDSSREGRTKEELQAIGDACFRGGNYSKSSGMKW
ncbi:hypothetical protein [Legionella pneumophila]|uniref:hypothetical protein n=1 Tax=Legionella pneumophila TaxID=446 RepID=UPI00048051C8|nr:hypothetical protein [Legionella pneumophila]VEB31250.1 Uncharacterised protein [Legionella pneumophila]HAT1941947.1 hypothetical protein [Legionella pneumophila]HAT1994937.1 hypothetical protein [Legionella pneumophila]HAT2061745.1 hypothetical protein [Legionella pneumophila]HAT7968102.1 hypothetical protein [Legionella pneumophila]